MKEKQIIDIFKNVLDNKKAIIKCGGLTVQGTVGEKCDLKYIEYSGLHIYSSFKNNLSKPSQYIEKLLTNHREDLNIDYNTRDKIIDTITSKINETYIHLGIISPYNVKSINIDYYDDITFYVKITYNGGSIIEINNIESIGPY